MKIQQTRKHHVLAPVCISHATEIVVEIKGILNAPEMSLKLARALGPLLLNLQWCSWFEARK
jgi:hypothetical protein